MSFIATNLAQRPLDFKKLLTHLRDTHQKVRFRHWIARIGRAVTTLAPCLAVKRATSAATALTDIERDGLLQGLNLDATGALAEAVSIPVIASGGLASLDDVRALTAPRARRLAGAIAGRALYDGRLDAGAALRLIRAAAAA